MNFLRRGVLRGIAIRSAASAVPARSGCPFYSSVAGVCERTLIAVKPDGVQRKLVGEIIKRFEQRGFTLVGLKLLQASEGILAEHYHDLRRKPFYPALLRYMASGPVVAMVWEGHNVVRTSRAMVGDTDSSQAKPGTIRGDFSVHISRWVLLNFYVCLTHTHTHTHTQLCLPLTFLSAPQERDPCQ
ncbi:hypothetical protein XENTR_v10023923 [Xenopus tropicalis]|nr:hypothetical protein XENTR_v10023923 [Xenopus tropicalis]